MHFMVRSCPARSGALMADAPACLPHETFESYVACASRVVSVVVNVIRSVICIPLLLIKVSSFTLIYLTLRCFLQCIHNIHRMH